MWSLKGEETACVRLWGWLSCVAVRIISVSVQESRPTAFVDRGAKVIMFLEIDIFFWYPSTVKNGSIFLDVIQNWSRDHLVIKYPGPDSHLA